RFDGKTCSGKLVKYKYAGAREAAEAAAKSTGKAWRIPSREELVSLYDEKLKRKPKLDGRVFPAATNGPFYATRAGTDDNLNAWLVNSATAVSAATPASRASRCASSARNSAPGRRLSRRGRARTPRPPRTC